MSTKDTETQIVFLLTQPNSSNASWCLTMGIIGSNLRSPRARSVLRHAALQSLAAIGATKPPVSAKGSAGALPDERTETGVPEDHLTAKNPLCKYGPRSLGNRGKARCYGN
jgi:hypothetical protein